ncbi:MAG: patatin family protein [Nocardiaceae bacterium]|nr:patatin family protein [Nocardiaceae bacterium]
MTPTVVELLRSRRADAATRDGHRLVLVVEGGASRGVYSSGMVLALEELGLSGVFDAVYGTSAGALNGAWLLCGRARSGMQAWSDTTIMRRLIDPKRLLRGGVLFDTDYLVRDVYDGSVPMDFSAILDNATSFHPIATDAGTGEAVDLHPRIVDKRTLMTAMRATCNIPILAGPPVELGGVRYLDGGIAEPLPIRTALAHGATCVVVLRTRQAAEQRTGDPRVQSAIGSACIRMVAPGAVAAWNKRIESEAADERLLADLGGDAVLQIRPPEGSPRVDRSERRGAVLARALEIGRQAVHARLADLIAS